MSLRTLLTESEIYDSDFEQWLGALARRIEERACIALADCNGGQFPRTTREWRRVCDFLWLTVVLVSPDILCEPCVRYDSEARLSGTLYLPTVRDRRKLYYWLLHEAVETAMKRELLGPEFRYPCEWGDHHDMARVVEDHHTRLPALTGPLADLEHREAA